MARACHALMQKNALNKTKRMKGHVSSGRHIRTYIYIPIDSYGFNG